MADKQETSEDIIAEMDRVEVCADGEPCLRDYARRFKAAWKREKSQSWHHREMEELILQHEKEVAELKKLIPQPDPDWKAICEKCHDGEIEPKCEYYGEPNGCNSPIYGEHPTAENSSAVGNAARLREAVVLALSLLDLKDGVPYKTVSQKDIDFMKAALFKPPRNCDVGTSEEQSERYDEFCDIHDCKSDCPLFKADSCELAWAQMPYEERGAK